MSFGGLSVALSLVFGCLLLGVIAQVYYFIWWKKKKRTNLEIQMGSKRLFNWNCLKKPFSIHSSNTSKTVTKDQEITSQEQDLELGTSKDLLLKSLSSFEEDSVESELMRLHNLAGPPRFLFTIIEETKEDLESEDGRSRKGSRTLSDFFDTPFLTPLASSPLKCPLDPFDSYKNNQGFNFNPLFESLAESDFNRFRSSPPPKFKFLRDAEEKLYKKLIEEARRKALEDQVQVSCNETKVTENSDGSFLGIIQNKETERKQLQQFLKPQFPSSSSQVLPLASSPTSFRPLEKA